MARAAARTGEQQGGGALLTFDGPLIDSLREYWASEVVELSPAALAHQQGNPKGGMSGTAPYYT